MSLSSANPSNMFKPFSILFLLTVPRWCIFCESFLLFVFRVCLCHSGLYVSFVVTCWERIDLLAFLCMMFSYVFITFPYGVLGHVCYLIVLIPDLCLLPYFVALKQQRRRPACTSAQSDGCFYYLFSGRFNS